MNISALGSGSNAYSLQHRNTAYVNQLNNKFSGLKIKEASRLAYTDRSVYKATIAIDSVYLQKTSASQDLQNLLENRLTKLDKANDVFKEINATGRYLSVKGYTIDRKGNITCHGTDNQSKEDFEIDLGKVTDEDPNYRNAICEHFGITATLLFMSSNS